MPVFTQDQLIQLREKIETFFNNDDIRVELCLPLSIEWENVQGGQISTTVLNLVEYSGRRNLLAKLLEQCQIARPREEWPIPSPKHSIPFTNRKRELKKLVEEPKGIFKYWIVHAPSGYGKSALLEEVAEQLRQKQQWACSYVQATKDDSLLEIARRLSADLKASYIQDRSIGNGFGAVVQKYLDEKPPKGKGLALIIDLDKEPAPHIVKELLEQFLPDLANYLKNNIASIENRTLKFHVIISGRYLMNILDETVDAQKAPPYGVIELSPFKYEDIRTTIYDYDLLPSSTNTRKDHIAAFAMEIGVGHPKCIAKIIEVFQRNTATIEGFLGTQNVWQECIKSTAEESFSYLNSTLGDPNAVYMISIYRYLDYFVLKNILSTYPIQHLQKEDDPADALLDLLERTRMFTRDHSAMLLKDGIVRKLLVMHYYYKDKSKFVEDCNRAKEVCKQNISESSRPHFWICEYIYQLLQTAISKDTQQPEVRNQLRDELINAIPILIAEFFKNPTIKKLKVQRKRRYIGDLVNYLRYSEQWELEFMVNYYLRADNYNSNPFNELLEQISIAAENIFRGRKK